MAEVVEEGLTGEGVKPEDAKKIVFTAVKRKRVQLEGEGLSKADIDKSIRAKLEEIARGCSGQK